MIHSAPPRRQGIAPAKPFQPDTFCDHDEEQLAAMMLADAMHIRKRRQREGLEKAGKIEPPIPTEQPWMVLSHMVIQHLQAVKGRTICAADLRKEFNVSHSQAANVMRYLRMSRKIVSICKGDYILAPEYETPKE